MNATNRSQLLQQKQVKLPLNKTIAMGEFVVVTVAKRVLGPLRDSFFFLARESHFN
jgi:hypothetical protein